MGAHPYMVGMLLIFHEKYVFVPIYGLGVHPYMVGMLFIVHEKYVLVPIYGLAAHPYIVGILLIRKINLYTHICFGCTSLYGRDAVNIS